jgi:hypothetical protein
MPSAMVERIMWVVIEAATTAPGRGFIRLD